MHWLSKFIQLNQLKSHYSTRICHFMAWFLWFSDDSFAKQYEMAWNLPSNRILGGTVDWMVLLLRSSSFSPDFGSAPFPPYELCFEIALPGRAYLRLWFSAQIHWMNSKSLTICWTRSFCMGCLSLQILCIHVGAGALKGHRGLRSTGCATPLPRYRPSPSFQMFYYSLSFFYQLSLFIAEIFDFEMECTTNVDNCFNDELDTDENARVLSERLKC